MTFKASVLFVNFLIGLIFCSTPSSIPPRLALKIGNQSTTSICNSKTAKSFKKLVEILEGWFNAGNGNAGNGYSLTDKESNWNASKARCQNKSGNLAHVGIRNLTFRNFVFDSLFGREQTSKAAWIGLSYVDEQWKYCDGSVEDKSGAIWNNGEPNGDDQNEKCVQINNRNRTATDDDCTDSYLGLCEIQCSIDYQQAVNFCPERKFVINEQEYTFPETDVYHLAQSVQACNNTGNSLATIVCVPPNPNSTYVRLGFFDNSTSQVIDCNLTITDVTILSARDFDKLVVLSGKPESLTRNNISNVARKILSYAESVTANKVINWADLNSIAQTISNLFSGEVFNSQQYESNDSFKRSIQTRSRLLQALKRFAERVQLPHNVSVGDIITQSFKLQVQRVMPVSNKDLVRFNMTSLQNTSRVFVDLAVEVLKQFEENRRNMTNNITSSSISSILYAVNLNKSYTLNPNLNTSEIISIGGRNVITTNGSITFEDVVYLEREITLENTVKRQLNQASFVRWDFENLEWSTSSCNGVPPAQTFQCEELGSFAILFSSRIVPFVAALTIVSYIGTALSIVFLLLSIFVYLTHRELRNKPITSILMNIWCCLVGVYVFYAVGVGRVSHSQTCDALTFLLHYFILACILWMTINAFQMYKALVKPLHYNVKRAHPFFYMLAYGLPFVLVQLNFGLTVLYFDKKQNVNDTEDIFYESLYRTKFTCWLQTPSLHWGFFLPVGILLLINLTIFVILLKKVVFNRKKAESTANDFSLADQVLGAVIMSVMMGLSWIFGYFLLIPIDVVYETTMQWLFTICNVFQGVVIFILYCLRREDVRNIWLPCKPKAFQQVKKLGQPSESNSKEYSSHNTQQTNGSP